MRVRSKDRRTEIVASTMFSTCGAFCKKVQSGVLQVCGGVDGCGQFAALHANRHAGGGGGLMLL